VQDVASDSFSNNREHCHIDKTRVFGEEDGVTDCPNCPSSSEKCGLGHLSAKWHLTISRSSYEFVVSFFIGVSPFFVFLVN